MISVRHRRWEVARSGSGRLRAGRRRLAVAALVAGLAVTVAACDNSPGGGADVAEQGYVSGDGSVRTWKPASRGEPVILTGKDFEGNTVDTAQWLGDVVVLNTWYAGCAPCRKEAPDLVALATERVDEGVHVLGINTNDDAGAAQAFQRTFQVPYPSIEDRSGQVVAALSGTVPLQAVPSTVVLDRRGRVAARVLGTADASTLDGLVDDVLAEPTGS